jgi:hypothetical protein
MILVAGAGVESKLVSLDRHPADGLHGDMGAPDRGAAARDRKNEDLRAWHQPHQLRLRLRCRTVHRACRDPLAELRRFRLNPSGWRVPLPTARGTPRDACGILDRGEALPSREEWTRAAKLVRERKRPAKPMVGAKRIAPLTSEPRQPTPRRVRRGLQLTESSMSGYPVHRSLPPARRCLPTPLILPDGA